MTIGERKARLPDIALVARELYAIEFERGRARCPFSSNHRNGDKDPSLRWDRKKGRIFCASQQCFTEKGVDAIGLVQTMERLASFSEAMEVIEKRWPVGIAGTNGNTRPKPLDAAGFRAAAVFPYGPNLRKVRLEHSTGRSAKGRPAKTFRWEHRDGEEWRPGAGGIAPPLYVNSVFRDRDQVESAVGFEGEQKADLAACFDLAAFSYCDATLEAYADLQGLDVTLWPDKDKAGDRNAQRASELISRAGARSVRIVDPPADLPEAGDIVDAVETLGYDRVRIETVLTSARPPTKTDKAEGRKNPRIWTLADLRQASFPAVEPLVEGLIGTGETALLVGKPKLGKSRLANQLSICLSRGEPFLGLAVQKPRRVLLLDLENRAPGAQARFAKMSKPDPDGDARIMIFAPDTLAANPLTLTTTEGIERLQRLVSEHRPDLLIVDTWRLLLGGDENKAEPVVNGLKSLSKLRDLIPNLAIIIVHHLRKQQGDNPPRLRLDASGWVESSSGHYALVSHVDSVYGLQKEIDESGEMLVFGGIARNVAPPTLILEDDPDTLLFHVAEGEEVAFKLFTTVEKALWESTSGLRTFTFSDVLERAHTKNKKAVSSMLRKATDAHLVERVDRAGYRRIA